MDPVAPEADVPPAADTPSRPSRISVSETGTVRQIRKTIVIADGIPHCLNGQVVSFESGASGLVMGFTDKEVQILLLTAGDQIQIGEKVTAGFEPFTVPVGESFVGRVVNALCEPLDGQGPIPEDDRVACFREAPGVLDRQPLTEVLETGIRMIDGSIPIGKGQRELVIGDRMTGKTTIGMDTILNQAGKDIICIYCCIGKLSSALEAVVDVFRRNNTFDYTIIVQALASASQGEQYLAPYTAASLGDYFMERGRDVFIVFDDLSKHAWCYRELSLLLERSPGREAYPGDIFYLHSRLLERAGRLSEKLGGGSQTYFPLVDTIMGDVTGYVPSNVISITDGQVYLNAGLYNEGFLPAIDMGLSVSRIGHKVQCKAMSKLSSKLRLAYIQYKELVRATKLKADISDEGKKRLQRGQIMDWMFIQDKYTPFDTDAFILVLYSLWEGKLDFFTQEQLIQFMAKILPFCVTHDPEMVKRLQDPSWLEDSLKEDLESALDAYLEDAGMKVDEE